MAKAKTPKSEKKPATTRGGARAGAGRKPKAITEMLEAVLLPMKPETPTEPEARPGAGASARSATEYALNLIDETMRDQSKNITLRLQCANELLNRTVGKSRTATEPAIANLEEDGGRIHVYIPDNGRKAQGEAS